MKDIEDEIPFELPDGWSWVRGSEILSQMTSRKPTGDFFNYIDIDAIDNKKHKIKQPKKIKVSDAPSRASRELFSGDILFSLVRPYLENIAFISTEFENCIASTGFFVCRPNGNIFPKYLYFLLISKYVISGLNEFMKGDNSPSISSDDIIKFFFPLPPLVEQQLIVAEIEKIFAQIDLLEQNKTDLQTAIKQAKSKILDLAIHGKLVSQDPNDEPASILLEKIRAEKEAKIANGELKRDKNDSYIYKGSDNCHYEKLNGKDVCIEDELPFSIPGNWQWCRLGEIGNTITGSTPNKKNIEYYKNGDFPFIKPKDLDSGRHVTKSSEYITEKGKKVSRFIPKNSIAVCCIGSIGKSGFLEIDCVTNQQINTIIPYQNISNLFIYYYSLSSIFTEQLNDKSSAVTISIVNKSKMDLCLLPLPPLSEQKRIVVKIEELFSLLDQIQTNLI